MQDMGEDDLDDFPLSALTCPSDGHVERVFLDSLSMKDLQVALRDGDLTFNEYEEQKEFLNNQTLTLTLALALPLYHYL